ncbi:MAG: VWA domain-containing protein [Actinomycetaceae bacterium]|nr:VWA domain-containing protein [Actinomycetaceae bacterium]
MTQPLLAALALVLLAGAALVGWRTGSRSSPSPVRVAHSGYLPQAPLIARRHRTRRRMRLLAVLALAAVSLLAATLAGLPRETTTTHHPVKSRDVVFCLDVSGSMLPLDRDIIDTLSDLVTHFRGERVALRLWNATTMTVFPLTDDYDLVHSELTKLSDMLASVEVRGNAIYASPTLIEYLSPTTASEDTAGSLIGDGLAGCALAFPESSERRSRSLILATDNLPQGSAIYTLPQAVDVTAERGIDLYTIYSTLGVKLDQADDPAAARDELARETARVNGRFYKAVDSSTTSDVLDAISSSLAHTQDNPRPPEQTDASGPYIGFAALFCLLGLAACVRGRL